MSNATMIRIMAGILLIGIQPLYFLPSIIGRQKHNAVAIFWVNLLTGWSVIGWIVVLIWAIKSEGLPANGSTFPIVKVLAGRHA